MFINTILDYFKERCAKNCSPTEELHLRLLSRVYHKRAIFLYKATRLPKNQLRIIPPTLHKRSHASTARL